MNILLIDRCLPSSIYSGKTVRLKHVYGRLAKEHKITFLRTACVDEEEESDELEAWSQETFNECLRISMSSQKPHFIQRLKAIVTLRPWYDILVKYPKESEQLKKDLELIASDRQIDLVITFTQEVAQYGLLLSKSIPWVQDLGDSMDLQMKRRIENAQNKKEQLNLLLRRLRERCFELEMIRKAKATIFVAEDDKQAYCSETGIEVFANGVDTSYFDRDSVLVCESKSPYVVFTGHMSFPPNEDAACHFAKEILPLCRKEIPNLDFKVVGADPSQRVLSLNDIEGVEVTGAVEDLRPYLAGAKAFVCPMRMGSGIKNKLLEAMSMGLPLVVTPLAIAGIENVPEDLVAIKANAKEFAAALVRVLNREGFDRTSPRHFVSNQYSWQRTLGLYDDLFASLLSKQGVTA